MDDWTYRHPDINSPDTQPTLLDQDWRAIEARRLRAQQADAASQGELEQAEGLDAVGDAHALKIVPLPFAPPPGAALTF